MTTAIAFADPEITGKEEAVIVPIFKGTRKLKGLSKKLDTLCHSVITGYLGRGNFTGEGGKTLLVAQSVPQAPQHILLLGLGERDKLNAERIAQFSGSASRALSGSKLKTAHLLIDEIPAGSTRERFLFSFLKGFLLAQYRFSLKGESKNREDEVERLFVKCSRERSRLSRISKNAQIVTEHTAKVRDMVNSPANTLTPAGMALEAKALCKAYGMNCRVMDLREIEKRKMGAISTVSKGSREEPRLIVMEYNRDHKRLPLVCLVGKGVTFDSGGISIKHWEHMNEMKGDMAGGALVINTLAAAARMKMPLRLVGIIPAVENLPDGAAFKPGDIVRTYAGKTIEVISTDAEGRLILCDALSYAREFDPLLIMDFATLTGACAIALGTRIAGVMGNHQEYIDSLLKEGKAAGEPIWQLPLDDSFREMIKGDITDYKNYSGRDGSTITAAALLAEFVGDVPWIHVDIAGTFWGDGGKISYQTKGGTGYGVDLTLRFLEKIARRRKKR